MGKLLGWARVAFMLLCLALLAGCGQLEDNLLEQAGEAESAAIHPATQSAITKTQLAAPGDLAEPTNPESILQLEPIKIHVPSKSLNFLPLYFGAEMKFFEQEGLLVSIQDMKSEVGVAAVVAGEIDYTAASGTALRAAAGGIPVRIVAYMVKNLTFELYAQPDIRSIKQLKGKALGVSTLVGTDAYALRELLRKGGINPDKDVTIVAMGVTANSFAGLQGKSLHAAILSPPFGPSAKVLGYSNLGKAADVVAMPQSGLAATTVRIQQQPDQVKRLIAGTIKSMQFIKNNKPQTVAYIAREFNISQATASGAYDVVTGAFSRDGSLDLKAVETELLMHLQVTKNDLIIQPEQILDFTLLEEVQVTLGLRK